MATMESLIGLVNRIQRACTVLGDYGGGDNAFSSLWESLPTVAVVGGQVPPSLLFSHLFCNFFRERGNFDAEKVSESGAIFLEREYEFC